MNNLAFLRRLLYKLKREYGYCGAIYRTIPGSTNLESGEKSVTRIKYSIDRVVILPLRADNLGFYGPALLKASREFAYGGIQQEDLKQVLIDGEDLPTGFQIQQDDSFVYDHKKFEIVKIMELEQKTGYQLIVNHLRGSIPNEVHEASIYQTLRVTQGVTLGS